MEQIQEHGNKTINEKKEQPKTTMVGGTKSYGCMNTSMVGRTKTYGIGNQQLWLWE
jgi:hypothetical protein